MQIEPHHIRLAMDTLLDILKSDTASNGDKFKIANYILDKAKTTPQGQEVDLALLQEIQALLEEDSHDQ